MIERLLNQVMRHPKMTLFAAAGITLFFAFQLPHVQLESAVEDFFISGDPEKEFFLSIKRLFGHDGVTVIAMVSPPGEDIFTRERLEKLSRLTERLGKIDGVRQVLSLSNVQRIYGEEGKIRVSPLLPRLPESPAEWAALKSALTENPMYERNLVSPDRRTAAINLFLADFDRQQQRYYEIMDQINALLSAEGGPEKFYVAGITATSTAINRAIIRDLSRFLPLTFGLIIAILFLSFRSARGVFLPLVTVVVGTVWTVGFMAWAGIPIGIVTVMLPPQIIAIGNAYTIYVFSEYLEELNEESSPTEVMEAMLKKAGLPLVLCAVTTMIGFASLLWNDIVSLKNMGIAAVVGVFFSAALALTVTPAILTLFPSQPPRPRLTENPDQRRGLLNQFVASLAEFNLRRRLPILAGSALISLIAAIGIFRVEFETDFLSFFSQRDPVTVANQAQQKYLAGAAPFFIILDAGRPDAFKDPALLRRVELFQNWMTENIAGLDLTISIVDYLKLLNQVFHNNDPAFFRLPDSVRGVAQLFLFYAMAGRPEDFAPYITSDYSMANIMVRSRIVGSKATNEAIAAIEEYARKWFGQEVKVKVTGTIPLVNKSATAVASGQMKSLLSSLSLIFIVMAFLFLSVKVGLIAMIPNVFPLLVLFGVMGYAGITINLATALISCITIGLVVDDTIHLLARYNEELKESLDPDEAMRRTLRVMSKPAFFTSVSLFFGFSILAGSEFVPIRQFGLLTAMTIIVAVLGDQVLLPAILSTVRITTLWDYVRLAVGKQARREIPLFAGLSPHQEKLAILMSVFEFHQPGEKILAQGEPCASLYVVLSGRVKAVSEESPEKIIAVVGEGGHFGGRPAVQPEPSVYSWVALENTQLLVINNLTLDRLFTSHPNIGRKIQQNLENLQSQLNGRGGVF